MKNGTPRPAPVVDLEPERCVRLRRGVGRDPVDRQVAVVLAPDVVSRVGIRTARKTESCALLRVSSVATDRSLHRRGRDHLHQVVDDDVAQGADRVVEVAAVLDPEVLRHRDLHELDWFRFQIGSSIEFAKRR